MKNILFCFDGTGNEPEDAVQEVTDAGAHQDQNISNVLKLHLRAGGRIGTAVESNGQLSFYYSGPGTRGGLLRQAVEKGLAPGSLSRIKNIALASLRGVYQPGDRISVFGFSRGAAIARRFVAHLQKSGMAGDEKGAAAGEPLPVAFLGVWDTVLSEGAPELSRDPRSPAELGEGEGIGTGVASVYHLVSIDDPRKAFTPTLFAPDPRVNEIWFAGVHSDVGGGYHRAGLSDITLEFMLERAAEEAGLSFMEPDEVALDADGPIDKDDLECKPDASAEGHEANFDKWLKDAANAIGERIVMTLAGGEPVLHESVIERGELRHYRPGNLSRTKHRVWGRADAYARFEDHFAAGG